MVNAAEAIKFFIDAFSIIIIGFVWLNLKNVLKMYRTIASVELHLLKKEVDYSRDCGRDEEDDCSDDCSEARPHIPEPSPFYVS